MRKFVHSLTYRENVLWVVAWCLGAVSTLIGPWALLGTTLVFGSVWLYLRLT